MMRRRGLQVLETDSIGILQTLKRSLKKEYKALTGRLRTVSKAKPPKDGMNYLRMSSLQFSRL